MGELLDFQYIFDRNPVAMCVVEDDTLAFVAVSDGAVREYGWSREEFSRMTLRDVRAPELVPALEAALALPDPAVLTTRHRRKDGSELISQGVLYRLTVDGRRLRFAVMRNVTAETQVAEAHRRSLEDYHAVVERSADGVLTHRPDGIVSYVNPALVAFLGYRDASEVVGVQVLDLLDPEDRERTRSRIDRILATGEPSAARPVRFLGKDGKVRWAETRGISVSFEGAPAVTVIARDLTERRRADEELRLSEERFSRSFRASPAAIAITRLSDGLFVDVNERFAQVSGYRREEVVGRSPVELKMWEDLAEREALVRTVERDGRARDVAMRLIKKTGERVDMLMSTEVIEVGGERCMLSLGRDVTERRRLEEQLQQARRMDALGRLAGGIAHDFNNLLTGIRGYGDLLLEQLPEGSGAREAAEHIRRATVRAASLTSQLLAFTRRQSIETRVIALDDLVRQLGALLRRIIGDDVTLALRLESERARVRVDPGKIEQVILNLAVNARDAMPRGGQLVIATARSVDASGTRQVRLSVGDTGSGMSDELRARIFEPFFTTKEVGKGTGLGLAIVYGIVEQCGGTISVDTAPGRGATFHIFLPEVDEPVAQASSLAPARGRGPEGHETILLVEDNEEVRDFVHFILQRAGYEVLIAEDGLRALEESARCPLEIQLLLSDVVMPRMSGGELAERIVRERPRIKILHMSGHPGPAGLVSAAGDERASLAFVQKPFSADELLRRVRAILDAPAA